MLKYSQLEHVYWAEIVHIIVYLLNRAPTKALDGITPDEAWIGVKPSFSHLHVFGCISYMYIPKQNKKKLDQKEMKCILLGYCNEYKAYNLMNPTTKKIYISRDVIFLLK